MDRYEAWEDEEARSEWKSKLQAFTRLYSFMSQIMPWTDRELEVRHTFGRFLLKRLPRAQREGVDLDGEVDLHSYRLARIGETDIELTKGQAGEVSGPSEVGTRTEQDEMVSLKEIIDILNERFGTDFTKADQLVFDQIIEESKEDQDVQARAKANTYDNFALSIQDKIEGLMIGRMDKNQEIVSKYLDEDDFKQAVFEHLARKIYDDLKETG